MRKYFKQMSLFLAIVFSFNLLSGCYGSFSLTTKLYKWNGSATNNKFLKSGLMWVLMIVPAYGVCGFLDLWVLNVVEFWTGKNPIAMGPNDKETKIVESGDKKYEVTATQNRFDLVQIEGEGKGKKVAFVFNSEENSWYLQSDKGVTKLAQFSKDDISKLDLIYPDGSVKTVGTTQTAVNF